MCVSVIIMEAYADNIAFSFYVSRLCGLRALSLDVLRLHVIMLTSMVVVHTGCATMIPREYCSHGELSLFIC